MLGRKVSWIYRIFGGCFGVLFKALCLPRGKY